MEDIGQPSYEYYKKDISRYKEQFEGTLSAIYSIVSDETDIQSIEARIKSYKSFLKNFLNPEINSKGKVKNVNDCFGIKVMLNDEMALENVINRLIEEGYKIISIKDHLFIPNTNYNAKHITIEMKGLTIPFELQLRTPERSKERLPHDIYKIFGAKGPSTSAEKVKVLEEFFSLVRLQLKGNNEELSKELPICYQLVKNEEGDKESFEIVSQREVITKLYPTAKEILGDKVFNRILNKLFPPGVPQNRCTISEEDKRMLELLFETAIQKYQLGPQSDLTDLAIEFMDYE